jgi:hypothetical protein
MRFSFVPTLQVVACDCDFEALGRASSNVEPSAFTADGVTRKVAVWRKHSTVQTRSLEATEARLLEHLVHGATFGEAAEESGAEAARIAAHLERWVNDELVSSVAY